MDNSNERFNNFEARYSSGQIPWAAELPPPEVLAFVAQAQPGRGLDLGCGYGRSSIYMARNGWKVDGVDYIAQAISEAVDRAAAAGVADNVQFHAASATQLGFLSGPYDFALDVGCMHVFSESEINAYRDELVRLLPSGAIYLLFAHLADETTEPSRWIREKDLHDAFVQDFEILHVEYGSTQVADNPPWPSAWYRFQRK